MTGNKSVEEEIAREDMETAIGNLYRLKVKSMGFTEVDPEKLDFWSGEGNARSLELAKSELRGEIAEILATLGTEKVEKKES